MDFEFLKIESGDYKGRRKKIKGGGGERETILGFSLDSRTKRRIYFSSPKKSFSLDLFAL